MAFPISEEDYSSVEVPSIMGDKKEKALDLGKFGTTALYGAGALAAGAVLTAPVLVAGGAAALVYAGYKWIEHARRGSIQTSEDLATGWYFVGNPRSGKTYLAMMYARTWIKRGYGGLFASIKGASDFMRFFPPEEAHRTILIQPHGPYPIGINPMQTYTGYEPNTDRRDEEHRVSLLMMQWFAEDVNDRSGVKMNGVVYLGTLAVLQWGRATRKQVCITDLQKFFMSDSFRSKVLNAATDGIKNAFNPQNKSAETKLSTVMQSVAFDLQRMMEPPTMQALFNHREGINLVEVLNSDKWLILDCDPDKVPDGWLMCRTLAAMIERLTYKKKKTARGGRPFFAIFDEIQHYATRAFADGISVAPEYGLSWVLIHQTQRGQLGDQKELHAAVNMCGNKFFFQQSTEDAPAIAKHGEWEAEELIKLPKRHYRAVMRINNGAVKRIDDGKTADIGAPSLESVKAILRNAYVGHNRPHRDELIKPLEMEA